ncbi:branched-chain amino acid ABC transporter permease [Glaciibacter superstes]|uniref:branched-chain amino acid ABC transporter permease n=1 Tax=Glaciibacter superstes TaxID=501023 RepID=UPI0003B351DC|nr:branched-chain amino acid ABC transporter permease [Glaciibacter superstes]
MTLFVQLVLNGLVAGSLYALMAAGLALILGATMHFHIAHAAVFASAGYLTYICTAFLGLHPALSALLAIAVAVLMGMGIVRFLYVPLTRRGGAGFILFLVSLGVLVVLDNIFTIGLGARPAKPGLGEWFGHVQQLGPWSLTWGQLLIILLSFGLVAGLIVCLEKTQAGKLVKAYSGNPEFFQLFGRKPMTVLLLVYAVGSFFGAIAGVYVAADTGMLPGLGEQFFIIAIMVVFIGGIGSVRGAFLAAMLLGVLQHVLLLWMGSEWTLAAVFIAFLALITISPQGLHKLSLPTRRRRLA